MNEEVNHCERERERAPAHESLIDLVIGWLLGYHLLIR